MVGGKSISFLWNNQCFFSWINILFPLLVYLVFRLPFPNVIFWPFYFPLSPHTLKISFLIEYFYSTHATRFFCICWIIIGPILKISTILSLLHSCDTQWISLLNFTKTIDQFSKISFVVHVRRTDFPSCYRFTILRHSNWKINVPLKVE